MKKSGGVSIPNSENNTFIAVTVVFTEGDTDVEKIVDDQGEVLYEAEGGGED